MKLASELAGCELDPISFPLLSYQSFEANQSFGANIIPKKFDIQHFNQQNDHESFNSLP